MKLFTRAKSMQVLSWNGLLYLALFGVPSFGLPAKADAPAPVVPQQALIPPASSPSDKPSPVIVAPLVIVSSGLPRPLSHIALPSSDLLAKVRAQASRLRAAPIAGTSQRLQENAAQRAAEPVKMLHDWKGDGQSAGWSFPIGKTPK